MLITISHEHKLEIRTADKKIAHNALLICNAMVFCNGVAGELACNAVTPDLVHSLTSHRMPLKHFQP